MLKLRARSALLAAALAGACAAPEGAGISAEGGPASLLERSTPSAGATVAAPPQSLVLVFRRPVVLAEVSVTGPDGMTMPMMVASAGAQARYVLPLDGLGPGVHEVRWRAIEDGATREGSFRFTVRG